MTNNKVLIIGSGGIGGFYGALLHKAGWQVEMVARSDHQAIREHGLRLDSPLGDLSFQPHAVYASTAEAGHADWLLISVKILPGLDFASLLGPVVGPQTKICLIANGLDIEKPLVAAFPNNQLISCVAFVGATRIAPGSIKHNYHGNLIMSNYDAPNSADCELLAAALNQAGIKAIVCPDINLERWKKSIWNASFNPLSVATNGADTGKMLGSEDSLALVRALMLEVIQTGRAAGFELADELADKHIEVTKKVPPYHTSMAQDYLHGRPIELEALVGSVLNYAQRLDVAVPHLSTLHQILRLRY